MDGWKTTFDTQIRASTDRGARTKFHLGRDEWRVRGTWWRVVGEGIFECSALETMYRVTHCSYSHRSSFLIFRYYPSSPPPSLPLSPPLRPALHLSPLLFRPPANPSPPDFTRRALLSLSSPCFSQLFSSNEPTGSGSFRASWTRKCKRNRGLTSLAIVTVYAFPWISTGSNSRLAAVSTL